MNARGLGFPHEGRMITQPAWLVAPWRGQCRMSIGNQFQTARSVQHRTYSGYQRRARSARMCVPVDLPPELPVIPASTNSTVLTLGETRILQFSPDVFRALLSRGSAHFAQCAPNTHRGALLRVLSVRAATPEGVAAEVRCDGRVDLAVKPRSFSTGIRASAIRDSRAEGVAARAHASRAECEAWALWGEVDAMYARLNVDDQRAAVRARQEALVWAPRRSEEVDERDWENTPDGLRKAWEIRAEAFSFAVLRCAKAGEEELKEAMEITNTAERLALGIRALKRRRAEAVARLCIRDALKGADR